MQSFAWLFNGAIVYHSSKMYKKELKQFNKSQFNMEKDLYYKLNQFLNNIEIYYSSEKNNSTELLLELVRNLIKKGFLGKKDLLIYKLFIQDLIDIGYIFYPLNLQMKNFKNNQTIQLFSKFKIYFPKSPDIFLNNKKYKIIRHYISKIIFYDILLIINYNHFGFQKLNSYLLKLYQNHFPNIIFIYPININEKNIISCNESFHGYFSYICLKKVYKKYPNFKGYLFINDDVFLKVFEIENLDFNIPWFYNFHYIKQKWPHYKSCIVIHNIFKNIEYKNNLTNFLGFYDIPISIADFYYIPNSIIIKFCKILEEMYNYKLFLECSIPSTMAIINFPLYQIIYFIGLWGETRNKAIDYLKKDFEQITIHPIKFSNLYFQKEVNLYNYFINAKEY